MHYLCFTFLLDAVLSLPTLQYLLISSYPLCCAPLEPSPRQRPFFPEPLTVPHSLVQWASYSQGLLVLFFFSTMARQKDMFIIDIISKEQK